MTEPTNKEKFALIAMMIALNKHGVPPDVQSLLNGGDERGTVKPGAAMAAVRAIFSAMEKNFG